MKKIILMFVSIIILSSLSACTELKDNNNLTCNVPNDIKNIQMRKNLENACEKLLEENANIGVNKEIQLIYTTNNIPKNDGSSEVIFFIVNKSGKDISEDFLLNINMTYKGEKILENYKYFYDVSKFGNIENNTLTPIGVRINFEQMKLLLGSKNNDDNVKITVDCYLK